MILPWIELAGVAFFAVSGALAAGRKSLDLLGVVVIAWVTATGGGTLRDLLLDRPVFWIEKPQFLVVALLAALLTVPYVRFARPPEKLLLLADALGLALFSILGAQISIALGKPGLISVVMGTITGAFGGLLRDVLCNEIPVILQKGSIYATAAISGCALMVLLLHFGVQGPIAAGAGMALVAVMRIAAIVFGLTLPVFTLPEDRRS
ncbi:trimeric intracellular cation channel family protein [Solimonas sp. K1W22B-7]|uniref:trimeric intracellular cation channel family protein n=1 Tax=Solimonas sp. K1W22B-7 TaxID=2303331 RepID=UPI000E32F452|nr:trimeric intracellular cation channel family protein [Solimonas sp. K1W22B-7]AXQ28590.1 trimeric intracellular cation channel family protein [Solimonas sp. K1W22B-7]